MLPVILLSVFLALSVDKLTEVRQLEANTAEETEKTEKRRNEKKQQIHDFRSTAEPRVRRKTIRRAMQFLSDNPEDRARQLQESRKKWNSRKQLSLPEERLREAGLHRSTKDDNYSGRGVLRSVSTPPAVIPQETDIEKGIFSSGGQAKESPPPHESGMVPEETPKLRNPLRLMRKRSEFFEKQKLRIAGSYTTDYEQSAIPTPVETHRSSSLEPVHKQLEQKYSLDCAGEQLDSEPDQHPSLFERTQSCPADSPISTVVCL